MDLRENLLREAAGLPAVPGPVAEAFARQAAELASRVRSVRTVLSGLAAVGAPVEERDIDLDHAEFMRRLLRLGDYRLLVPVLTSVYRATAACGRPIDDNRIMLDVWIQALGALLPGEYADPIAGLYRWMRDHHEDWQRLAEVRAPLPGGAAAWSDARSSLIDALARGDQSQALELAQRATTDPGTLREPVHRGRDSGAVRDRRAVGDRSADGRGGAPRQRDHGRAWSTSAPRPSRGSAGPKDGRSSRQRPARDTASAHASSPTSSRSTAGT